MRQGRLGPGFDSYPLQIMTASPLDGSAASVSALSSNVKSADTPLPSQLAEHSRFVQRVRRRYENELACLPPGPYHVLPLIGVHPQFQGQQLGEKLLGALHDWCAEDAGSQGVVLDTGNPHYLEFYKRQGYEEIGEVAVGPIREHVFFHANPQLAKLASG